MITIILSNILWILYSCVDGVKDGFYWHFKNASRRESNFDIHPIFTIQRGIVLISMGILLFYSVGIYSILLLISMMMVFSFFHNGSYYLTRNKLDSKLYQKGWSDQSTTSTAKLTKIMTYRNRTLLMIIGILIEVFISIFLIN